MSKSYNDVIDYCNKNLNNRPLRGTTINVFKEELEERGIMPEYLERSFNTYLKNFATFSLNEVIRLAEIYQLETLEVKKYA